ncbi:MAG: response regulator transcription factor [Pseudomonadota bacterium]
MIKLVLVDDHTIVRNLLRDVFSASGEIEVIGDAGNGEEALDLLQTIRPDVIVMDVALPGIDGIETSAQLRARGDETPIICLTMHLSSAILDRALQAGINGYAVKHDGYEILIEGIRTVAGGGRYISPSLSSGGADSGSEQQLMQKLSKREREVVSLVASGWTAAEIADHLSISERTVDYHRRNIAEKTGLRRIADITKFAINAGVETNQ